MFMKVDFPDPEDPMIETNSPVSISKVTPPRAGITISPTW
jgi:hypothetical protein